MRAADAAEAWRKYVSTGALARSLLRDPVYRAWERSHVTGADPRRMRAELLSNIDTERVVEQHRALVEAAKPYMAALSRAAGAERHAAMLGDASGIVLDVRGDERSVRGPESVPGPGSLLAEAQAGANGIGSPLGEGGYVELEGPEHFIGGFHPFTCQGVPVRAPDGSVAGVISLSVRRPEAGRRIREILVCAARGLEAELLSHKLHDDATRVLTSPADEARHLEALRQDLVQAYAAARLRIDTAARLAASPRNFAEAIALVRLGEAAVARFERQAEMWRNLASDERSPPAPVDVDRALEDLVELLHTEARTRATTLLLDIVEPTPVLADRHELARALFRRLLEAMDLAGAGGGVSISVVRGPGEVQVRFDPYPRSKLGARSTLTLDLQPAVTT